MRPSVPFLMVVLRAGTNGRPLRPLRLCYTVLSFVGSTGSTTISFILPGLFWWKVSRLFECLSVVMISSAFCTQLSRDDPSANKTLSRASLGLAIYGMFIFVFW